MQNFQIWNVIECVMRNRVSFLIITFQFSNPFAFTLTGPGVNISQLVGYIELQPEMPEHETPIDPEDLQEPPVYEMIIIFVILILTWIIIIILLMKKP